MARRLGLNELRQDRTIAQASADEVGLRSRALLYRTISQDTPPTVAQCQEDEWVFWVDTNDANRTYLCRRTAGVLLKVELV